MLHSLYTTGEFKLDDKNGTIAQLEGRLSLLIKSNFTITNMILVVQNIIIDHFPERKLIIGIFFFINILLLTSRCF